MAAQKEIGSVGAAALADLSIIPANLLWKSWEGMSLLAPDQAAAVTMGISATFVWVVMKSILVTRVTAEWAEERLEPGTSADGRELCRRWLRAMLGRDTKPSA